MRVYHLTINHICTRFVIDMPQVSPSMSTKFEFPVGVKLLNKVLGPYQQPLVAQELIDAAKKRSGLSDFGTDFFVSALEEVCKDVNTSSNFHPLGAFLYKNKVIMNLVNRLWSQYWLKKEPNIDSPLPPAVLITGLQRTGTTASIRLGLLTRH